jgi:pantoate--beta-alanine ligase
MGALHRGHHELVAVARRRADRVVVSVFVNPLQFNQAADFDGYPRPIDRDLADCESLGVDEVYAPTAAAMYPPGHQTRVTPGRLADVMEGPMRPGHFEGVTTVVTKLFGAVRPDLAVFGEKDFQQLAIITQMAADLDTGIEIVPAPIVRDHDGVALSSRNERLDATERAAAVCVPRSLEAAAGALAAHATVDDAVRAARRVIDDEPLARLEYLTVFRPDDLVELGPDEPFDGSLRIATAVWIGDVRLIDNRAVDDGT